jgi:hypothetical protein
MYIILDLKKILSRNIPIIFLRLGNQNTAMSTVLSFLSSLEVLILLNSFFSSIRLNDLFINKHGEKPQSLNSL